MKTLQRDDTHCDEDYVLKSEALAEIAAAVAKERERCARIVETQDTYGDSVGCWFETLAAKIRA